MAVTDLWRRESQRSVPVWLLVAAIALVSARIVSVQMARPAKEARDLIDWVPADGRLHRTASVRADDRLPALMRLEHLTEAEEVHWREEFAKLNWIFGGLTLSVTLPEYSGGTPEARRMHFGYYLQPLHLNAD